MRLDKPIKGARDARLSLFSVLDTNPEAWNEYLETRKINPKIAQRRISQLRASRTAALSGRKAEL